MLQSVMHTIYVALDLYDDYEDGKNELEIIKWYSKLGY
jgi:hypothetical protein